MRLVADTNIVVSGLLWRGAPRQILDLARRGDIHLFTSGALLYELRNVLDRRKFRRRLELAAVSVRELILGYAALARIVEPATLLPVITADPDDDAVLACAVAAGASRIVSGDHHLLELRSFQEIDILTAREFLDRIESERGV